MALTIASSAFLNGGEIPSIYTCEGENISPPLEWDGIPEQAQSLVLIIDDPDAPDPRAPKMTWVHWVVYNIPVETTSLAAGAALQPLPFGSEEGLNDWKQKAYGGPCPPIGRHRYFHKLYALDTQLKNLGNPAKEKLLVEMEGHIIAEAVLYGTYEKSR